MKSIRWGTGECVLCRDDRHPQPCRPLCSPVQGATRRRARHVQSRESAVQGIAWGELSARNQKADAVAGVKDSGGWPERDFDGNDFAGRKGLLSSESVYWLVFSGLLRIDFTQRRALPSRRHSIAPEAIRSFERNPLVANPFLDSDKQRYIVGAFD